MAINPKSFRAKNGLTVGDDTTSVDVVNSTGKWTGSAITTSYGGTGITSFAAGDIPYANSAVADAALTKLAIGTSGKLLRSSGTAPAWSTSTFPDSASATVGTFLRSDGTNYVNSALVLPNSITQNSIWYGGASNTLTEITPAASSILVTNGSNVPSLSTTLPAHTVTTSVTVPTVYGQAPTAGTLTLRANSTDTTGTVQITTSTASSTYQTGALVVSGGVGIAGAVYLNSTLNVAGNVTLSGTGNSVGTITSGIWNGTALGVSYGGTGSSLTASNGGIVYSSATTLAVLAGTATANKVLLSGASAAPTWSTATYPTTVTGAGKLIRSSGNDAFSVTTATYPDTATGTGTLLRADGTNWAASTLTIPNTISANSILYASSLNTLAASSNLSWNESVLNLGTSVLLKINNGVTAGNTLLGINSGNTGHEYKTLVGGEGVSVSSSGTSFIFSLSGAISGATAKDATTWSTYKVGQNLMVGAASTAASKTVSTASWATNEVTISTGAIAHGFLVGDRVVISGINPSGYNGTYIILSVTTYTFNVSLSSNPGSYSSGGTIYYTYSSIDSTNALDVRAGAGTSLTNLIAAYSSNDQTTNVFKVTTSGAITATGKLSISIDDANNSSVVSIGSFKHTTSGSPITGIGTRIDLETETTGGVSIGSSIRSVSTNIGIGTEAFDLRLYAMTGGSEVSTMVLTPSSGATTWYGSVTASNNLTISPTSNATNGVLTLTDLHHNKTSVTQTVSGTITNTIVDSVTKGSVRSAKYLIQVTQGTAYDIREVLIIHDGSTALWTEYGRLTSGAFTDFTYDFNVGASNLEFRVSGTSLPVTVFKIHRTYLTQ